MSSNKQNAAKKNKQEKQSLNEQDELKSKAEQNQQESAQEEEQQSVQSDEEKGQQLAQEAEDYKKKYEAINEKHLRLMAEFDNFRKRTSRDYERLIESANEKLMLELIEVRENFDRALRTTEKTEECKSFFEGMELIYSKFCEILGKNGLTPFAEIGEPFDPQVHDALMNVEHGDIPENHITEVFEKGYRLKEKVIKHARVIVSSGAPERKTE